MDFRAPLTVTWQSLRHCIYLGARLHGFLSILKPLRGISAPAFSALLLQQALSLMSGSLLAPTVESPTACLYRPAPRGL